MSASAGHPPSWQETADLLWLAALAAEDDLTLAEQPLPDPLPAGTTAQDPRSQKEPLPDPTPQPQVPSEPEPGSDVLVGIGPVRQTPGDDVVVHLSEGLRRRSMTKALRAFRRRIVSPYGKAELDEVATATRAAGDDLWLPVFSEPRERMMELEVVIDDSRLSTLHRGMAVGFTAALADSAAFRVIRTHLLDTDVKHLHELGLRALASAPGTGRRLIVVLTDGIGDAWHTGAAHRLLASWGKRSAVAVIHLLPARLWRRTGVSPELGRLRTSRPAGAAADYHFPGDDRTVAVPVIGPEPAQVRAWAGFVMATETRWSGAVLPCLPGAEELLEPVDSDDVVSPEERVWRFRMGVSPTAFELAVRLAAAPLSPSVMQMVRRRLVPGATTAHLAEVLASDLVKQSYPPASKPAVPYDFLPGVRAELLQAGRRSATAEVLVAVADHLGEEIDELRALRDVIISPTSAVVPDLPPELEALVDPALEAFEAMAGGYIAPARQLRAGLSDHRGRDALVTAGNTSTRDLPRPEDSVYPHVVKEPPTPDPFGVTIKMSDVPRAPKRESHEPTPVWNVPQKNVNFTGREEMLEQLHERLSAGTTAVLPEALHGLGGVGKSQIAVEYCYRHQEKYDLIWWIPSERLTMVRQAFVDLAVHLDLNVTEPNVAVPAVKEALRLGRPYADWLLVFDNAEDVEEIRRFFPTNGPGKIMVTSRSRDWFSYAAPLEVDVFTRVESRELLRLRGPELSDTDADEISSRLGDLPLAIEQAAVWLSETGMPVSEYLQLFDDHRNELLHVEGAEVPVAAAWNVSFDRLRESDPAALQLLQVCAFLAPEPIPRALLSSSRDLEGPAELLEALRDPITLSRTTRAINQYALAKLNHRDNTISLHRLVQRVVTSQLSEDERLRLRHCGHLLLANADPRAPGNRARWPEYHALFPHVFASKLEECSDPWARGLFLNLIDFLYLWGDHNGFLALAQRAFDAWNAQLGPTHDATLSAELRLGRALRLFDDFQGAYRHHLHAVEALRERLGPDHERTLEAQGYLGADLRYLGRFSAALELDQRAYETLRRRFGSDDPLTLEQAHLLAIDYRLTGDPAKARELDSDTQRRKEEVLGPDSLSTISSRVALIIDVMESGDYLEARRMQELHTNEMRRNYQNSHPGTMDAIAQLSVMSRKAGRQEDALKLSEEAMSLYKARYGEKYQTTVAITLNHAINLRYIGDLSQSLELGIRAKEHYEEIFGPEHPNSPTAAVNIAVTLRVMGRLEEARDLDRKAMADLTRMLGANHPRTLISAINYASDLYELGDYEQALELDRRTFDQLMSGQGSEHPTTLACMFNLSLDLKAVGQDAEAAALLAESLAGYRRVLGEDHPAIRSRAQGRRANCDIYPIAV